MQVKTALAILAICFTAMSVADAAFVIKLKNGNQFITSRYWLDSRQVLFETYDGIFGIDKALVVKVEKSEKPIQLITAAQVAAEVTEAESDTRDGNQAKKPVAENQDQAAAKKNEQDPIFKHFLSIRERSKNIGGMLSSELSLLAKDLGDLKRAMQLGGKTSEFLDEFRELHEISERVEDVMTGRR